MLDYSGKRLIIYIAAFVLCLPGFGGKKSYKGFKVVRIELQGRKDWMLVANVLDNQDLELELWSVPSAEHDNVDVQIPPHSFKPSIKELDRYNLKHSIFIDDIQSLIEDEEMSMENEQLNGERSADSHVVKRSTPDLLSDSVVGKYANLSEIDSWLELLAQKYPSMVELSDVGKTYENRSIHVLRVGRPHPNRRPKPAIYLDGGIHAREWISPSTVIHIIHQLINGYHNGISGMAEFLNVLDWYFVPVANPDGYYYTHTEERLWRKNRAPNDKSDCKGTDLNRNWDYQWGLGVVRNFTAGGPMTPYTSNRPCSIVYQGPYAGSELETQALMRFLSERNATIKAFISHHSYTQKWFTRWGYTNTTPPDHQQMMDVAQKAVKALEEENGESYDVGRPFEWLYPYTGGSADWAKGVAKIKYAYTVELRDRGQYGFLLPANYVTPVGEELWAAVKVVASQLINETKGHRTEGMPTIESPLVTLTSTTDWQWSQPEKPSDRKPTPPTEWDEQEYSTRSMRDKTTTFRGITPPNIEYWRTSTRENVEKEWKKTGPDISTNPTTTVPRTPTLTMGTIFTSSASQFMPGYIFPFLVIFILLNKTINAT